MWQLQQTPELQEKAILTQIQNLIQRIALCAPHPYRPDDHGPQFLPKNDLYTLPDDHDSLLGECLLEHMIGLDFWHAANDVLEAGSNILQDRTTKTPSRPVHLGQTNAIRGRFNSNSNAASRENAMKHYLSDLPRRKSLETWLAHYTRRLYALRKHNAQYGPAMAAA